MSDPQEVAAQPARPAQGRRPHGGRRRGRRGGRARAGWWPHPPAGQRALAADPAAQPQAGRDRRLDLAAQRPLRSSRPRWASPCTRTRYAPGRQVDVHLRLRQRDRPGRQRPVQPQEQGPALRPAVLGEGGRGLPGPADQRRPGPAARPVRRAHGPLARLQERDPVLRRRAHGLGLDPAGPDVHLRVPVARPGHVHVPLPRGGHGARPDGHDGHRVRPPRPGRQHVLYPSGKYAYNDGDGSTGFDREYVMFLSEVFCDSHWADAHIQLPEWSDYRADFSLLNGRVYPDTLLPNGSIAHDDTLRRQPGPRRRLEPDPPPGARPTGTWTASRSRRWSPATPASGSCSASRTSATWRPRPDLRRASRPGSWAGTQRSCAGEPASTPAYETNTLSFGAGESFDAIVTAPAFSGGVRHERQRLRHLRPLQPRLHPRRQPRAATGAGSGPRSACTRPATCRPSNTPTSTRTTSREAGDERSDDDETSHVLAGPRRAHARGVGGDCRRRRSWRRWPSGRRPPPRRARTQAASRARPSPGRPRPHVRPDDQGRVHQPG